MERTTSKVCAEKNKMMTVSNRIPHNTTTTMMVDAVVGVATSNSVSMKSFMIGWKAKQMTFTINGEEEVCAG
jgi:hypothetical protein